MSGVILLNSLAGVDAERTLRCQRGASPTFSGDDDNASLVNDYFANLASRDPVAFRGGSFEIADTITTDYRWGQGLVGAGATSRDLGDTHYTSPSGVASKAVTRLVWVGDDDGTMIRPLSSGSVLGGMHLQGCAVAGAGPEPTGGTYPNRAKIGIHVPTTEFGTESGAKLILLGTSFYQVHTGLLMGHDLENVGADTYEGHEDDHADTVVATGPLFFYYPFSGVHAGQGTAIHIRNFQSFAHWFPNVTIHGTPEYGIYVERGGRMSFGHVESAGGASTLFRFGKLRQNTGGISIMHASIDGFEAKLVKGDVLDTDQIYRSHVVFHSFSILPGNTSVPQIDVGPGCWNFCNGGYLKAGSIKMRGITYGGGATTLCHVHLENVALNTTNIASLVDGASVGPYLLTWRNCTRFTDGGSPTKWGQVYEDSTPATEIKSGVTRLAAV